MATRKRKRAGAGEGGGGGEGGGEERDIAETRKVIEPLVMAGVSHFRLASACGAHPEDLRGFLEGRVSLTPALRARLREAVPGILGSLEPR